MRSKILEYTPLSLICLGAFLMRILGQWDKVFVDGNVWYRGVDAWYHMRLTDAMMENFPSPLKWDVYAQFPSGAGIGYRPLLQWVVSTVGQVFNYEIVGALLPPVAGVLMLIPLYLICKMLFSKNVGLLACLLVAVLPGEFFHRSLLGFTDHHILEVSLMVTTLLFLLLDRRDDRWLWRIPAGIFLGFYMLNWAGAAFFLLILGVWIWIEALRNTLTLHYVKVISIPVAISFAMSYEFLGVEGLVASVFLILSPTVALLWRRIIKNKWIAFVPLLVVPSIILLEYTQAIRLIFWGGATYIAEAAPIDLTTLMRTYGISIFLMFIGAYLYIRSKGNILFLTWAIILVFVTIGQRRWGYYTTIPVAIFTSYFVFYLAEQVKAQARVVTVLMISFFLLVPMVNQVSRIASLPNNIQPAWYNSLVWLRANSPDPIDDESYYSLTPDQRADYGIISWWDYGNWIIRISQRVPKTSPTLAHKIPAQFFTAQSVEEAMAGIKGKNYKYVIIDYTLLTGKWYAVVERAGYPKEDEVRLYNNSMLVRLWTGPVPGFKLVYREGHIMIFEVMQ